MKNLFIEKFREQFGNQLSTLYIPGMSQKDMFTRIIFNIVNVSNELSHAIHNIDIKEIADKEYLIKVNHSIEIEYIINQKEEVTNG